MYMYINMYSDTIAGQRLSHCSLQFTGSYGGSEETPLAITCAENFREAAAVLIEAGARTDYRCSVGSVHNDMQLGSFFYELQSHCFKCVSGSVIITIY